MGGGGGAMRRAGKRTAATCAPPLTLCAASLLTLPLSPRVSTLTSIAPHNFAHYQVVSRAWRLECVHLEGTCGSKGRGTGAAAAAAGRERPT